MQFNFVRNNNLGQTQTGPAGQANPERCLAFLMKFKNVKLCRLHHFYDAGRVLCVTGVTYFTVQCSCPLVTMVTMVNIV